MGRHRTGRSRVRFGGGGGFRRSRHRYRSRGVYSSGSYGGGSGGDARWVVWFLVGIVAAGMIAGPIVLLVFGVIEIVQSEDRQNMINLFNEEAESKWNNKTYTEFSESVRDVSLMWLDNDDVWQEMDMSNTYIPDIKYEDISDPEDFPQIVVWRSYYFQLPISFGVVTFDTYMTTKFKVVVNGETETQHVLENAFTLFEYDCNCYEDCYWIGDDEYCDEYCYDCYRRSRADYLCATLVDGELLSGCYYSGKYAKYGVFSDDMSDVPPNIDYSPIVEIRHTDDPENLLSILTKDSNYFGRTKSDKLGAGITFLGFMALVIVCDIVIFGGFVICFCKIKYGSEGVKEKLRKFFCSCCHRQKKGGGYETIEKDPLFADFKPTITKVDGEGGITSPPKNVVTSDPVVITGVNPIVVTDGTVNSAENVNTNDPISTTYYKQSEGNVKSQDDNSFGVYNYRNGTSTNNSVENKGKKEDDLYTYTSPNPYDTSDMKTPTYFVDPFGENNEKK